MDFYFEVIIVGIVVFIVIITFLIVKVWNNNGSSRPSKNMVININVTIQDSQLELPFEFTGSEDVTIDWGDGSSSESSKSLIHTYVSTGTYQIKVTGKATSFGKIGGYIGNTLIISVTSWGNLELKSLDGAFSGAINLAEVPNTVPNTVTDMIAMFQNTIAFNKDLNSWNTGAVTNMSSMFSGATAFNGNISSWNTGAVTNMAGMFSGAKAFNGNIGSWNTGAVTTMDSMFFGATTFNQDINYWTVTSVTNAQYIFFDCPVLGNVSKYPPFNDIPLPGLPDFSTDYYG